MKKEGNYAKLEHFVERTALLFVEGRAGDGGGGGRRNGYPRLERRTTRHRCNFSGKLQVICERGGRPSS